MKPQAVEGVSDEGIIQIVKWIALGALFAIPFTPLIVANNLFFPFIAGKGFAFRVLVEIAFFAWVFLAVADVRYRPRWSWQLVAFGLLVLWMMAADAFGVNPHKSFWSNYERMDGWVTLVHSFALFVVAGSVLSVTKLFNRWWNVFLIGAALIVAYGFLQIFGVAAIHQSSNRIDATLGNSAYLAAYLLFVIPVTLWQAVTTRVVAWRFVLMGFAVLSAIALFYTGTRGALIGAIVATLSGLFLYIFLANAGASARRYALAALIAFAVLVSGLFLLKDASWIKGDPTLGRLSSISFNDLAVRSQIWHMALKGFADSPILGFGQEGFNQVFNTHYEPALYAQEEWFDRAHNVYLDWLIAGGLPALLLFLALLVLTAWTLFRRGDSPEERVLLVAALIAYMVQSIVVFDNLFTYVPLAMLFAFAHAKHSRSVSDLDQVSVPNQNQLTAFVAPIVVVFAIVTVYFVNVPSYRAGNELIEALVAKPDLNDNLLLFKKILSSGSFATQEVREQLTSFAARVVTEPNIPEETRIAFFTFAVTEMQKQIAENPKDARLYIQLSYAYRAAGLYEDALVLIREAEKLSPKKQQFLIEEGNVLLTAGRPLEARDAWSRAYELDTSFDALAVYKAAGDIATGNLPAGKAFLLERFGTTTVDSDVLMYAYYITSSFDDMVTLWYARIAAEPHNPDRHFGLVATHAIAGRTFDARTELENIKKEWPEQTARVTELLKQLSPKAP